MRAITPVQSFAPELLLQAQAVRAAIFDVDGVLTDGRIYLSERGEEFKAFSTLDGHGLKLLAQGGITPIVITGRDSPAVRRRVADLGIAHAVFGAHDKLAAAEALLAQLQLSWEMLAAMGTEPRLRIMRLLLSAHPRGMVVGDIGSELGLPGSTLSHHLEKLKNVGLVSVTRESTFLRYAATTETLQELLGFLYAECCTRNQAIEPEAIIQIAG